MPRSAATNRLTDIKIKSYLKDDGRTTPLHDGGGLYLRKRATGAFWVLRLPCPMTGKDQWHQVFAGEASPCYPARTLADARIKAGTLRAERATGIDPREARKSRARREAEAEEAKQRAREAEELQQAQRLSVRQLFERWRTTDLLPRALADGTREGRKDGGEYVRQQFERHVFAALGDRAAADITRLDLMTVLDAQKSAGKLRTANVLFSDLKQMFAFAVDREIANTNPLEGLKRRRIGGKDTERERVLSDAELQQLWAALPDSGLHPRGCSALGLVLATGVRAGEVMGAAWADASLGSTRIEELRCIAEQANTKFGLVDVKARSWHLPDTKNQREHTIHLSDFALARLAELAALRAVGPDEQLVPWLFPDRSGLKPVCVKSLGKQIADRQRAAKTQMQRRSQSTDALLLSGGHWTLHDLRRTAATVMARLGISNDVIDECLNHKQESKVGRIYIRDRREAEQQRALDALGQHLAELSSSANCAKN
jgi:integrase